LAQGLVDAVPGAVVAPASVPGVDRGPGREVVRQQAPLAAGADQVEDGVEHLAQFGRRPAGALGPGEERLDEGELVIGQVSVITLGSHNPFYGSEPGFRTGSKLRSGRNEGMDLRRGIDAAANAGLLPDTEQVMRRIRTLDRLIDSFSDLRERHRKAPEATQAEAEKFLSVSSFALREITDWVNE